jgi:spore coat protein H
VDKAFLDAHQLDGNSDIYRCGMFDCELREGPGTSMQRPWLKRTNEDKPMDELWAFLKGLKLTPSHELEAYLGRTFDVDEYLRWLAVDAAISNNNVGDSRSYLIREPGTGLWHYVPWDLNNAKSMFHRHQDVGQRVVTDRALKHFTVWDPYSYELAARRQQSTPDILPTWSVLGTRLVEDERLRARYVERLRWLLEGPFREEVIGPRLAQTFALLKPHLDKDPWVDRAFVPAGVDYLMRYVRGRRAWLLANLPSLERHPETALKLDRAGRDAAGHLFVQIINGSKAPQSTKGLYLTAALRHPRSSRLPDVLLRPGEVLTLRSAPASGREALQIRLNEAAPELGLFHSDGKTALDIMYLPPLGPGVAYGREPRGAGMFRFHEGP